MGYKRFEGNGEAGVQPYQRRPDGTGESEKEVTVLQVGRSKEGSYRSENCQEYQSMNSHLNVVVWSLTLFGWGQSGCWSFRGSRLP